jgi:peptidoglycan/LPS O-acetylase OafA/YrhL
MTTTSATPHTRHMSYRPDIDGLRAIAVLVVVLYHAFPDLLPGGFVGVDIFFIISGYLISSVLFQSIHSNSFSIFDFYSRRIRRIFPALSLVLLATGIFGWFALRADEFAQLGKHIAAGAGFVSNLVLWGESGYFDAAAESKPLLHLWSLGIEEQFYFFFPLVLWAAWKLKQNLLVVTAVIATGSFIWNLYQYSRDTTALFYSPQTRFWELMIGAILAYITVSPTPLKKLVSDRFSSLRAQVGVVFVVLAVVSGAWAGAYPGAWALFPTIGATLLISAGPHTWVNKHVLSQKVMVGIGLISYPLYLWHWPLLTYARILEGRTPPVSTRVWCVIASFVLAYATYRLIEKPLRFHARQRVVTFGLASAVLLVGAGGFITSANDGFENRNVNLREVKFAGDIGHVEFHEYVETKFFPCTPDTVRAQAETWEGTIRCSQSRDDIPVDTILLGDSHAEHLYIGLAESLPEKNVAFYIRNGMAVDNNPGFDVIFDAIKDNPKITQVVIGHFWTLRGVPTKEMTETVRALQARGIKVFITDGTPDFLFDPALCKFDGECAEPAEGFEKRYDTYASDLDAVVSDASGLELIKTAELLCNAQECAMGTTGKLYFRDFHHLNIPGSQFVGAEIVRRHPSLTE